MLDSIWPESNGGDKPLPAPNVVVARAGTPPDQLSPEATLPGKLSLAQRLFVAEVAPASANGYRGR